MIRLIDIIDEDFVNYKVPSMSLIFPFCTFKCGKENCQNYGIRTEEKIEIPIDKLCERYINNPITEAIVCQGLEPMDSFDELRNLIGTLRSKYKCNDYVIIYTGYEESEIEDKLTILKKFKNVIVKFGRFIPNQKHLFDNVLGVELSSSNQYAKYIS